MINKKIKYFIMSFMLIMVCILSINISGISVNAKDNSVVGTGDVTVFTDKKGDYDNILQKGDCATKGSIDNPLKGTKIKVTNKTNGITYTFTKNDNGSLPNAIIDIWKTGVTNLGIDSKNYDNIKKAGKYTYKFK